jgi:predicted RND superfamily exporter protein
MRLPGFCMSFHRFVSSLTAASLRRWRVFLAAALVLTGVGLWLAKHLEVRSSFEELLPEDVPSVKHAKELAKRVGGDGTVLVVVESLAGPEGLKAAEALASKLANEYRALGPDVVRSVETDILPIEHWYADHWPMFLPLEKLERARDELVKVIGQAKAEANPMLNMVDEGEEHGRGKEPAEADRIDLAQQKELDELLDPTKPSPREKVQQGFDRYIDGYMVHPDRRSVTIVVRPTGTSLGVSEVRVVLDRMRAVADAHKAEMEAQKLRVGFGGSYPVLLAEYESIIKDAVSSFILVMTLVLVSILLFYRQVRPVLAVGAALLVAIACTFGITWLVIGYLNTQTAFLGSIVAGNGINYGLVYLARVGQLRRRGVALETACHEGAQAAARATLLAAVGTSVAFGTLLVATNRGFRHFGFIGGIGMLLCWAATFALIPALLVLFEKIWPHRVKQKATAPGPNLRWLEWCFARPRVMVSVFAVLTAVSVGLFIWHLPRVMERNLNNLTNDELGSAELRRDNDRAQTALGQSIGGSVALLPSREAAEEYCDAIRQRIKEQPRLGELINGCETVSTVVPLHQQTKLDIVKDIRERLTDRVLARLAPPQAARAREIRDQLGEQKLLTYEEAPHSLIDRFRERNGAVGNLAFVRSQPNAKLELGPNLRDFVKGVRDVPAAGGRYDAAGADIVIADLLADIERQGPTVTMLSFLCVCVLVVLFFRTWARSTLLLVSLTVGVALMAGVAALTDLKINFFNFIVYPITFGIAVDYGANVLARMGVRRNVLAALAEVGPAVILCSWTTIIGYGSLILSFNRALRSFGWYAMLGELTTLITALTLLPAMALLVPPRSWMAAPGEAIAGEDAEDAGHGPLTAAKEWSDAS